MIYVKADGRARCEGLRDDIDISEQGPTVPTKAEVEAAKIIAEFRAKFRAEQSARQRERSSLSQRESEIVALVAEGFKNKEIAEKMFISVQTVKNHLHNIFDKLGSPPPSNHPPTPAAAALPSPRRRSGLTWAVSGRKRPQGA
jgi:ATP/maltotriose-dependent transcriptional regulator MalT